jgi:hypothetical protein
VVRAAKFASTSACRVNQIPWPSLSGSRLERCRADHTPGV